MPDYGFKSCVKYLVVDKVSNLSNTFSLLHHYGRNFEIINGHKSLWNKFYIRKFVANMYQQYKIGRELLAICTDRFFVTLLTRF